MKNQIINCDQCDKECSKSYFSFSVSAFSVQGAVWYAGPKQDPELSGVSDPKKNRLGVREFCGLSCAGIFYKMEIESK